MRRLVHLFARKLKTFGLTTSKCSNWVSIALAKMGIGADPKVIYFRNGSCLKILPPLRATWGEIFEPAIADVYGIRDCSPDFIIDVGANIGAFSCFAAHAHPQAQIHAFEPSSAHADLLERNIALNRLTNVTLHRQAVTRDAREVVFSQVGAGGASGIVLQGDGPSTRLESVSLDCIDFSPARFSFIKLDCEGAEGEIIEWICANLNRLPSQLRLACEYHHWCPIPLDRLLDILRSHGLRAEHRTPYDESYIFAFRGEQTPA
jgi:FkbM family methyltransferase